MSDLYKEKLALEEVKQLYNQINEARNILDEKAMSLLSNTSLILTLFGVLQIALVKDPQPVIYKIGLAIVVFLYFTLACILLWILRPQGYRGAFEATWAGVKKAILHLESQDAIYQLISNYFARIRENKAINVGKKKWLQKAMIIFSVIMLLLICLSLFVVR
jgi:hypothetical protein